MKKALIIVDLQKDFMEGGSLAVSGANDKYVDIVSDLIESPEYAEVIFTQDWHPKKMDGFASSHEGKKPFESYTTSKGQKDTLWPDHCIAESYGAMIHEGINLDLIQKDIYFFKKGLEIDHHPYSAFDGTGLSFFLQERGVDEVYIVGLALDYCVKDTAIDSAMKGFETIVVIDATRPIAQDAEGLADTFISFMDAKVRVIESWEMPMYNFY